MWRLSFYFKKLREVWREDGLRLTVSTALRYARGCAHLFYLRRIKKASEVIIVVQGNKMAAPVNDPGIGRELIIRGCHEKLATREMQRRLKPGMHVVDLGANIGYYALIEASRVGPSGKVYAIEPVPSNYELLVRNVKLNAFYDIVQTYRLAVGDQNAMVRMNLSSYASRHSFVEHENAKNIGAIEVPMTTFDQFVDQQGIDAQRLDLVRMDVEGYEAKILPGMAETLRRCKSILMFIEFHPAYIDKIPGCSFRDTLLWLRSRHTKVHSLILNNQRGKVVVRDISIDDMLASQEIMKRQVLETWLTVGCKDGNFGQPKAFG